MDNTNVESNSVHDTTNIIDGPYSTTERKFDVSNSSIIPSSINECNPTELLDLPTKNLVGGIDGYDVESTAQTSLTGVSSVPKECYDDDDDNDSDSDDVGSDQEVSSGDSWISLSKLTNINFLKEYEDLLNDQYLIEPILEKSCIDSNNMINDTNSKSISQSDATSQIHSNMDEHLHVSQNEDELSITTQNHSDLIATHDSKSNVPYLIPNVDTNDNFCPPINSQQETDCYQLDNDLDQMDCVTERFIADHGSNPLETQLVCEDNSGEQRSFDNNVTVEDNQSTNNSTCTYQASTQQLPKSSVQEDDTTSDTSSVKTIHKFSLPQQDTAIIIPSKEEDDSVNVQSLDIDSNSDNASIVENALERIQQTNAISQSKHVIVLPHRIFIDSNQGDSKTKSQTAVSQDDTVHDNVKNRRVDDTFVDESSNVLQRTCQSIEDVHTNNVLNQGNDNCSTPYSVTNVSLAETSTEFQKGEYTIEQCENDNSSSDGYLHSNQASNSGELVGLAETSTEFQKGEYTIEQCENDNSSSDGYLHSNQASNSGKLVGLRAGIDANDLDIDSAIIHSSLDSVNKMAESVVERNVSRLSLENAKSAPKDSSNDGESSVEESLVPSRHRMDLTEKLLTVDVIGSSDCLQSEHLGLCNNDSNALLSRQQHDTQDTSIILESHICDSSYSSYHSNNVAKSSSHDLNQGNASPESFPPCVVAQHDTFLNDCDSTTNHCNTDVHNDVAKLEESSPSSDICLSYHSSYKSCASARKGDASSIKSSASQDKDSFACLSQNEDSQRSEATNVDITLSSNIRSGSASVQDPSIVNIQTAIDSQASLQRLDCSITDSTISVRRSKVDDRRFNKVHSNSSKRPEMSIDKQYHSEQGICLSKRENDQHRTESEGSSSEVNQTTSDIAHSEDSNSVKTSIVQAVVQSAQTNLIGEELTMSSISASSDNANNPLQKLPNCYANGIKRGTKRVDDSSGSEESEDSDGTRYPSIYFSTQIVDESTNLASQRNDWGANHENVSNLSLHYSVGSYATQLNDLEGCTSMGKCEVNGSNVEQIAKTEMDFVSNINHMMNDEQEEISVHAVHIASVDNSLWNIGNNCNIGVSATSRASEEDYNESVDDVFRNLHGKSESNSELQDMVEYKKQEAPFSEASNVVITRKSIKFANMSDFEIFHQASSSDDSSTSTVADSEVCMYDQESYAPSPSSTKSGKSKLLDKSQSSRFAMMHTSLSRKSFTGKIIPSIYFDHEMSYTLEGSENSSELSDTNESGRPSSSTDIAWNPSNKNLEISVASTSQSTDIDILNDSLFLSGESLSKAAPQISEYVDPTTFLLPDRRNVCPSPIQVQDITSYSSPESNLLPLTSLCADQERKKNQDGMPVENTFSCNHRVSPEFVDPANERMRVVETSKVSSLNADSSTAERDNRDNTHMHDLSETSVSGLCKNGESPCHPLGSKSILDVTSMLATITETSNVVLHLPKNETEKKLKEITETDLNEYEFTIATGNSLDVVSVEDGLDVDYVEASENIFRDTLEILDNSGTSNFELKGMFFMAGSDGSPIDNSSLDSTETKRTLYQTNDRGSPTNAIEASEVKLSNIVGTLSVEAEDHITLPDECNAQQLELQSVHEKSTIHEVADFDVLCRSECLLAEQDKVDTLFEFGKITNEAARSTTDEDARESQSANDALDKRHSTLLNELEFAKFNSSNSNTSSLLSASRDASQSLISEASEECENIESDMIAVQAHYLCSKVSEENQSNSHDLSTSSPIRLLSNEQDKIVCIESSNSIKNTVSVNTDEFLPNAKYVAIADDSSDSTDSIEDDTSEITSFKKDANQAIEWSEDEETGSSDTQDDEEAATMVLQGTIPKLGPIQGEQQEAIQSSAENYKESSTNDESSKSSDSSILSDVVEKVTVIEKPLVAECAKNTVATGSALLSAARAQNKMNSSASESEGSSNARVQEIIVYSFKKVDQNESDCVQIPSIEDTIRCSSTNSDPRLNVDSGSNVNAAKSILGKNGSLRDTEALNGMPTQLIPQGVASHSINYEVTKPQVIYDVLDLEDRCSGIDPRGSSNSSNVVKLKGLQGLVAGGKLRNASTKGADFIRISKVQELASSTSPVVDNLTALPKVRRYDAHEHNVLLPEVPTKAVQSKKVKVQHPILNLRLFNTPDDSFSSIGNSITESSINLDNSLKRICHGLAMVQEENDCSSNANYFDKGNFEGSPQDVRSIDQGFLERTIEGIDKVLVESKSNIDPKILEQGQDLQEKNRVEESKAATFTNRCTMEYPTETGKLFDLVLFLRGRMVSDIELDCRMDPPLYEEEESLTDPSCGLESDVSTSSEYLIWQDLQIQRSLIVVSRQLHPDPPAEGLCEWTGLDPPDNRFFTSSNPVDSATVMSNTAIQSKVMEPSELDDQADHSERQAQHCSNTLHKNSFEMPDNETYILRQHGSNENGTSADTASAESNDVEMGGRMPCSDRRDTTLSIGNGRLLRIPSIVLLIASSCFMLALTAIVIPFALYDSDDSVQVVNPITKPSTFPTIGLSTPPVSTPPIFAPNNEALAGWDLLASFTGIVEDGFASAVAISDTLLIIGSPVSSNGTVQCFYSVSSNQWVGVQQMQGKDVGSGFGSALGLKGSRLIVGAPSAREPTNQTTIGAAYAYTYNEIGAQLIPVGLPLKGEETASPGVTGEEFGSAVATSSGFRLAVGAPGNSLLGKDTGRIYTYEYREAAASRSWMKMEKIALLGTSSGDRFGSSIDLSADGNILIAGAPGRRLDDSKFFSSHGFALVYRWSIIDWQFQVVLQGDENGEGFGSSVISLSDDGEYLAIGAPGFRNGAGRIKVYQYNATSFSYNQFGSDVVGDLGEELGLARTISGTILDQQPLIFASTALGVVKRFDYNSDRGGWEQRLVSLPDSHSNSLVVGLAFDGLDVTAVVGDNMMARSYVYHVNGS